MGDVVRSAIIPLSQTRRCAHAEVMMDGACVPPIAMVTHNWTNLFRDLVAAILADALGEAEYDMITYMLDNEFGRLEKWVEIARVGQRSYWVCAFCVNQHAGICGENRHHSRDAVTGEEHPVCNCCVDKAFNDTEPVLVEDRRSIPCEMNKFDDMMELLSAQNSHFSQVIAVDAEFTLFSRAWCMAEVAAAHKMGMRQSLKVASLDALNEHEARLRDIRIEDMEAARPEDKDEILHKIQDCAAFNARLQVLLFEDLLPGWKRMDVAQQLDCTGQILRWQVVARSIGSLRIYNPRGVAPDNIGAQILGVGGPADPDNTQTEFTFSRYNFPIPI